MIEKPCTERVFLLGILMLAFGLRFWALGFGLPALYHADEPIVVNHALAFSAGDLNPHFFKIPPLTSYLLFGFYALCYLAGHFTGRFPSPAAFENFFYGNPGFFYFSARFLLGVIPGTLTVYFLYRLVRRHFDAPRALAAAFLMAVCFLHVTDSHYVYADIPLLLVLVCALDDLLSLSEKPQAGFWSHLGAGGWIGLAAAFKYNGAFLLIPYAVVLWKTQKERPRRALLFLTAAGAAALGFFTVLNPYWLLDFSFFVRELQMQARSNTGVGMIHHVIYSLPGALGWPVLGAALAGMAVSFFFLKPGDGFFRQFFKRSLLGIFVIGYYLVLAAAGQPYARYSLPLLPGCIFFAVDFLFLTASHFQRKTRVILCVGMLMLSGPMLVKSLCWDRLMAAPDVRDLAKTWTEQHLPQDAKIALDWDFYMPRLSFSRDQLMSKQKDLMAQAHFHSAQQRRLNYLLDHAGDSPSYELYFLVVNPGLQDRFLYAKPVLSYDLGELEKTGIQYVFLLRGDENQYAGSFYADIARRGKLVAEFSPYKDKSRLRLYDKVTMTGGPFTWSEIWNRERGGVALEVYQLDGGKRP